MNATAWVVSYFNCLICAIERPDCSASDERCIRSVGRLGQTGWPTYFWWSGQRTLMSWTRLIPRWCSACRRRSRLSSFIKRPLQPLYDAFARALHGRVFQASCDAGKVLWKVRWVAVIMTRFPVQLIIPQKSQNRLRSVLATLVEYWI